MQRCYGAGMSRLSVFKIAPLLILVIVLSCSSSEEDGKIILAPAPTVVVPDNYTKFTDESESFSIHYPNHWYTESSQLEDLEEWVNQSLSSKIPDADLSATNMFLMAGESDELGELNPNVNALIERVPKNITVEEYAEGAIASSRATFDSLQLYSQQPVTLGGVSAYMFESSFELSEAGLDATGRFRAFQVAIKNPGEGIVWVVTCGFVTPNPPPGASETCNTVVRSSQLLQKD